MEYTNNKKQWTKEMINRVWEKGKIIPGVNPNEMRQDIAGAWISYPKYGDIEDELGYGWEIDHRIPKSLGGIDALPNLRPLQCSNNRSKSDNYPKWTSIVSSNGDHNVREKKRWNCVE